MSKKTTSTANSWLQAVQQYKKTTGHLGRLPEKNSRGYQQIKALQADIINNKDKTRRKAKPTAEQQVDSNVVTESSAFESVEPYVLRQLIKQAQFKPQDLEGAGLKDFMDQAMKRRRRRK